jgi:hypothetical protein
MKLINIKLINGEEIVGQVITVNDESIQLKAARTLMMHDMGNGQPGASFIPVLLLNGSTDEVLVNRSAIAVFSYNINMNYEKRYLESVSGIQLATSLNG